LAAKERYLYRRAKERKLQQQAQQKAARVVLQQIHTIRKTGRPTLNPFAVQPDIPTEL
jgi:hemerythrin superfamily protein